MVVVEGWGGVSGGRGAKYFYKASCKSIKSRFIKQRNKHGNVYYVNKGYKPVQACLIASSHLRRQEIFLYFGMVTDIVALNINTEL